MPFEPSIVFSLTAPVNATSLQTQQMKTTRCLNFQTKILKLSIPEQRAGVVHDVHCGRVEQVPEAHDALRGDVFYETLVQA